MKMCVGRITYCCIYIKESAILYSVILGIHYFLTANKSMEILKMEFSGVARALPGGRLTHPEDQNEEENLRKPEINDRKMRKS